MEIEQNNLKEIINSLNFSIYCFWKDPVSN